MASSRKAKSRGIARYLKAVKGNLARAEAGKALSVFKNELSGLKVAIGMMNALAEHTDDGADGYAQNKVMKRSLWQAARELELQSTNLEELITQAEAFESLEEINTSKFYSRLLTIIFTLERMTFGGEIPRQRITKDEAAQIDAAETSAMERYSELNTSQPGALGDAALSDFDPTKL